jgi:hypothetical protein
VGITIRALSATLAMASILTGQQPAAPKHHPKLNPLHWIHHAATAEVALAERFSSWGISDEATNKPAKHPPKRRPHAVQANSHR